MWSQMKRRQILQTLATGAVAANLTGNTISADPNPPSDSNTSCGSWEYMGSACPQTSNDYRTADSSNCYYEYSCNSGYYRRECCYEPYGLDDEFTTITITPVGVEHHADLATAVSQESAWVERCKDGDNCPTNYWQTFCNISSNAAAYDDVGKAKCLLSESNLTVDRSGDGHLYTYIDDSVPEEDYVGATDNLDKSTLYNASDYGQELLEFAISLHPIAGPAASAQETIDSMASMANAEYDHDDTIELGYSWGNNSDCNYGRAAVARHWLLFEVKQMEANDSATITVTDECTVDGPTMSNTVSLSLSAPPATPSELRSMSAKVQSSQNMETTTLGEVARNPSSFNIPRHVIENRPADTLVYIGDT